MKNRRSAVSEESAESKVRLISVTPDAEANILYIARVSSNQENTDTGLIGYLVRKNHWSPFEHATMTLEIITSRALAPQFLRHRSFTFQEFSQRYASPTEYERYEARRQAEKNRQSSIDDLREQDKEWFRGAQEFMAEWGFRFYEEAVRRNIAKECARFLLPTTTTTKIYMTGTVRSWIHFIGERQREETQLETRLLALEAKKIFTSEFPIISDALGWDNECVCGMAAGCHGPCVHKSYHSGKLNM